MNNKLIKTNVIVFYSSLTLVIIAIVVSYLILFFNSTGDPGSNFAMGIAVGTFLIFIIIPCFIVATATAIINIILLKNKLHHGKVHKKYSITFYLSLLLVFTICILALLAYISYLATPKY